MRTLVTKSASCLIGLAFIAIAFPCRADFAPDTIARVKQATAVVVVPTRPLASAVCINAKAGLFITNGHVVDRDHRKQLTLGTVSLVLNANEPTQRIIKAKVIRIDRAPNINLAIIQTDATEGLVQLKLADPSGLSETQSVAIVGTDGQKVPRKLDEQLPPTMITVRRVVSIAKTVTGRVTQAKLDTPVVHATAGAPAINEVGEVVGTTRVVYRGQRSDFIVPANVLRAFIDRPDIAITPQTLTAKNQNTPLTFDVQLSWLDGTLSSNSKDVRVELQLIDDLETRAFPMSRGAREGQYLADATPLGSRLLLPVEFTFPRGSVKGAVWDRDCKIGLHKVRLRDVTDVSHQNRRIKFTHADGTIRTGNEFEPDILFADLGGNVIPVDLTKIKGFRVSPPLSRGSTLKYRAIVSVGDQELTASGGQLSFAAEEEVAAGMTHPVPVVAGIAPPVWEPKIAAFDLKDVTSPLIVELPEKSVRTRTGGAGRFLIFLLPEAKKLAVFDVTLGKIAGQIPFDTSEIMFAAGLNKLLVLLPTHRLIQRYDLHTLEREQSVSLGDAPLPRFFLMGANSHGPLLTYAPGDCRLWDVSNFSYQRVPDKSMSGSGWNRFSARISADGRVVSLWADGITGARYQGMRIGETTSVVKEPDGILLADVPRFSSNTSTSHAIRWAMPTTDARNFCGPSSMFDSRLQRITAKWLENKTPLPTNDRRFFLAAPYRPYGSRSKAAGWVTIATTADRRELHTITKLDEMAADTIGFDPEGQPRYHFLPSAKLLVTLPPSNDRLVMRRFDLLEALKKSGNDYLYVTSVPPLEVERDGKYSYQLTMESNAAEVSYAMESGPDGMTVSAKGLLEWSAPDGFVDLARATVSVKAKKSGQEVLHSFSIYPAVHVRD